MLFIRTVVSVFGLLLSVALSAVSLELEASPAAGVTALEWDALVPDNWESPLIAPAHDKAMTEPVNADALVSGLDGKDVRLPGFMRPVIYQEREVSEFLLVPFLPQHVSNHAHLDANQMVYVKLSQPLVVDNPFQPIWVDGTMKLETTPTDEGPAGYLMTGASVSTYDE